MRKEYTSPEVLITVIKNETIMTLSTGGTVDTSTLSGVTKADIPF